MNLDPAALRDLARTMRSQAGQLGEEAAWLLARAESTPWVGLAGDAMRASVRERCSALRRTADLHEDAARALERHAHEVQRVLDLIASIEERVLALVTEARSRLGGLVGAVGGAVGGLVGGLTGHDPVDELLAVFVPPPHGSPAWLDVDLPGVDLAVVAGRR